MKLPKIFSLFLVAGTSALLCSCASTSQNTGPSPLYVELTKTNPDLDRIDALTRADPNAQTPSGQSCLYHAILIERLEAAETMAAAGARLTSGEAFALFEPYEKKKNTRRYKFLQPMFTQAMLDAPAARPLQEELYTCVAGDSAQRIAMKLRCTVAELEAANPETNLKTLRKGQKLNLPIK